MCCFQSSSKSIALSICANLFICHYEFVYHVLVPSFSVSFLCKPSTCRRGSTEARLCPSHLRKSELTGQEKGSFLETTTQVVWQNKSLRHLRLIRQGWSHQLEKVQLHPKLRGRGKGLLSNLRKWWNSIPFGNLSDSFFCWCDHEKFSNLFFSNCVSSNFA